MQLSQFEQLVEKCLTEIPEKFRDLLENITVFVEPEALIFDKQNHLILGHYKGVPLPSRGPAYQGVLPDKIIIYKKALEKYPEGRMPDLIRNVVMHEIGHYFGMSEEELAKYKRV